MDTASFPSLTELRTRTSEKWTAYPPEVLPLFVAELDVTLAEPIARALHDAVDRSDTGYIGRATGLQEAFSSFAAARWDWIVDPSRVSPTTDVSVVVVEALRAVVRPGEGVVITPPVYAPFQDYLAEVGARRVDVPLERTSDSWRLDLDGIEAAFAAGARAMVLCNPHNPLGLVHDRETLERLAAVAERHGAVVISDEIHAPLTHPDAVFTPYLSVSDAAREHGIAAHSASKAFNLAGLKCALFVTASERMASIVAGMPIEVLVRTSQFGALAATAAYRDGAPWLDSLLAQLVDRRRLVGSLLAERMPAVGYREPRASYLAWLDFTGLGWGEDPSVRALEAAGVALNPGPSFGAGGEQHARLNFGCSVEVLTEAIGRLAAG